MASLGETVREALDESFKEQIKGLYGAAWAKVTGGEPVEQALKEFDRGLLMNLATVHKRVMEDADRVISQIEGAA
jgi:hypothetical protein